jgi:hypothetical protein
MKNTTLLVSFVLFALVALFQSCSADKLLEPPVANTSLCDSVTITFDNDIKGIFDASCNYSGCHDGNSYTPFANYSDMDAARRDYAVSRINDGSMPPSYATGPFLTTAQKDSVNCWKLGGYPK